jgi:hypothetical protein
LKHYRFACSVDACYAFLLSPVGWWGGTPITDVRLFALFEMNIWWGFA